MVDDEIASTSSLYSGLQLRSRRVPRTQTAIRTPSPSPPPRKKGGVLALLVGEEPHSTAERDGLQPSTRERESTHHEQGDGSGEDTSSDPVPETRSRRRDRSLSPLREIRELLSQLTLHQERQAAALRQQQREQDRQRRELEALLRGPASEEGLEDGLRHTHRSAIHVIGTPRSSPNSPTAKEQDKECLAHKFNGNDPAGWIELMEYEFEFRQTPEERKFSRALALMDHHVILKWRRGRGKYPQTWEGLKQFLGVRFGKTTEHHAREKLSRLQWKGSVDILDSEIRDAMDMCTAISEKEILSTFLSLVPPSLRSYFSAKSQPGDGYDVAVALCLEQESRERDWTHHSHVRRNGERSGYGHPSSTNNRKRPEGGGARNSASHAQGSKGPKPPCKHCKGRGHHPDSCATKIGSTAPADTMCYVCKGEGHFARECTSPPNKGINPIESKGQALKNEPSAKSQQGNKPRTDGTSEQESELKGSLLLADSTGGQKAPSEHMQTGSSDPVEGKGGLGGDRELRAEGDRDTDVLQEVENLDYPPESWSESLNLCSWAQEGNCDSQLASAHHHQAALQFRNVDTAGDDFESEEEQVHSSNDATLQPSSHTQASSPTRGQVCRIENNLDHQQSSQQEQKESEAFAQPLGQVAEEQMTKEPPLSLSLCAAEEVPAHRGQDGQDGQLSRSCKSADLPSHGCRSAPITLTRDLGTMERIFKRWLGPCSGTHLFHDWKQLKTLKDVNASQQKQRSTCITQEETAGEEEPGPLQHSHSQDPEELQEAVKPKQVTGTEQAGCLNTAAAADFHPLTYLEISISGKPLLALLDTGATHNLISRDLVDDLQLPKTKLDEPTRMILGNGKAMDLQEIVKELRCRAGELHFKINAVIAPIPFNVILGQPFLTKERLWWGFAPLNLTGWRGGKKLDLPLKAANRNEPVEQEAGKMASREIIKQAHNNFLDQVHKMPPEEAKGLVRPSPKRYKNFKTAGSRAHVRRLVALARAQSEGKMDVLALIERQVKSEEIQDRPEVSAERMRKEGTMKETALKPKASKAPCMLVSKKTDKPGEPEKHRLVINYRELNKITISPEVPIPNITTIMEQLQGSKYFTLVDMESGFHQVRMAPEDQHKTAFRCYFGHFEFKVMPFGLKGAPGTFQQVMNDILWPHLAVRCAVYLNDVLVFSPSLEQHVEDVRMVLSALREHKMYPKISKCKFARRELDYLGFTVGAEGVKPSTEKVKDVQHWPEKLKSPTDVLQFLGLVGFVRNFMGTRFADMAKPLTELTKKKVPFVWTDEHTRAVRALKQRLINYTMLQLPDPDKPYVLWTDASVHSLGAVLLQDGKPLGFLSKKMNEQQQRYATYYQELLALMTALKKWEHLLRPATVTAFTDHQTLQHLLSPKSSDLPNRMVQRWLMFLANFPGLTITYKPGKENVAADCLSRNPAHRPAQPPKALAAIAATRSGRLVRPTTKAASLLDDPLLYELPDRSAEPDDSSTSREPLFTVGNSGPQAQPQDPALVTSEATSGDASEVPEQQPQREDTAPGVEVVQSSGIVSAPTQTAVNVRTLPNLPNGTVFIHVPSVLNGFWGETQLKELEDTADLQRAQLGTGPQLGSADWLQALRDCPVYGAVTRQAEDHSPHVFEAAAQSSDSAKPFVKRLYKLANFILYARIHGCWKIIVPNLLEARLAVLYDFHDHPTAGHMGFTKTYKQLTQIFYWEGVKDFVKRYVETCARCQASKAVTQKPAGYLHSLAIPLRRWDSISMDYITGLPTSTQGNDAVLVVIDRLTKMAHFIPLKTTATAADVANLFTREVVRLHGVPTSIITDRDPRFLSQFWEMFTQKFGIKRCLSTAFHPQTDGQTERMNQTLERMLRTFIQLDQAQWENLLPALGLAYNSTPCASTGLSPFQVLIGENPPTAKSSDAFLYYTTPNMRKQFRMWVARAVRHLALAQRQQQRQANKKRRDLQFKEGDRVWLSAAHLPVSGSPKLRERYVGPFPVERVINDVTYRLTLPPSYTVYPVFHVSLLKPYHQYPDTEREQDWAPMARDGQLEFEVDAILDMRGPPKAREYLVQWKGQPAAAATWEPKRNLTHCRSLLRAFHRTYNRSNRAQDVELSATSEGEEEEQQAASTDPG
ncbi:hypothetical protein Emed_007593 [Eimeria media]